METNGNNKKAFTLVELLVVISIIALLLSILMPSLSRAREQAKRVICATRLHNMSIGLFTYDVDYRELPSGNFGCPTLMVSHKVVSKSYGIPPKSGLCPSARYKLNDWYAWGTSNNGAGQMQYIYFGGNGGNGNPLTDGWYITPGGYYFAFSDRGYRPYLSISKGGKKMSQMPLMLDIAANWQDTGWNGSAQTNHIRGGGVDAKVGENILFYDGHNEWQELVPRRSWKFGGGTYQSCYITSPGMPGTAPGYWYDYWNGRQ
jgi:prepilin-type N-terminal cleavage/methylation domain-containing protein